MPATLFVLVFVGGKLSKLSDFWGPPQRRVIGQAGSKVRNFPAIDIRQSGVQSDGIRGRGGSELRALRVNKFPERP